LKGRLLEGALLSGTWELAFVAPVGDGEVPLAVAALHHRRAALVEQALSEALDQLERTWPIRRSPRSFTASDGSQLEGGCFTDLPLLPALAPCWVVTPDALLIGYRGEAIDVALAPAAVSSERDAAPEFVGASGLDVHLDRLKQLDERIAPEEGVTRPGDLFSSFEVRLRGEASGRVALQARLRSIQ
jgi:hypothetical protein